ncbi:hypothetical protein RND71_028302 [Anisodus tanguticus]|uniref:Uncharacterized protein n=1 Tax=Anisodus tanguticus TaxID=243964 RepID=A0AAE1RI69_9SOLA|nr:hypothetical protein RND71_028302 [Anisodus tanguticus]
MAVVIISSVLNFVIRPMYDIQKTFHGIFPVINKPLTGNQHINTFQLTGEQPFDTLRLYPTEANHPLD